MKIVDCCRWRRFLFLFVSFVLAGIGAFQVAESAERVSPQDMSAFWEAIPEDLTCPVCGMYPARYPKWNAQIIFQDGQSEAFDGCADMFRFLLEMEKYDTRRSVDDIKAVYVKDFFSGKWIEGRAAYYVVGSKEMGPMGKEIIPFADKPIAETFLSDKGGRLTRYQHVDRGTVEGLGRNSQHRHRHGAHEPIAVMGGHLHSWGEWMVSYRYMRMDMDGNRKGTDRVSTGEVLRDFMVAPRDMTMEMHMLGLMYAPSDTLTLAVMVPYTELKMDHVTRMGTTFTTESEGLGDIRLNALYSLLKTDIHQVHLNAGISFPAGDIDQRDDTPAGLNQKLPYPMQLGSGTFDLLPGFTYLGNLESWSWGFQALAIIRLGENDNDYTLGDQFELSGWIGRRLGRAVNASLRLNGQSWGDIDGADPDLNPMMVPTADPDRRGGTRLDALFGLDYMAHQGLLAGNRLAIEAGGPVYQRLDGPQLETDWLITAGWQIMW